MEPCNCEGYCEHEHPGVDDGASAASAGWLAPCPFCGGAPVGPEAADTGWWIECPSCEIVMDRMSKAELISAWNKRES